MFETYKKTKVFCRIVICGWRTKHNPIFIAYLESEKDDSIKRSFIFRCRNCFLCTNKFENELSDREKELVGDILKSKAPAPCNPDTELNEYGDPLDREGEIMEQRCPICSRKNQ